MASVFSTIYSWFAFVPRMTFKNVIEIALIALLVYEMLLWIKNTRAWTLLRGILFILAFFLFATILQLLRFSCLRPSCSWIPFCGFWRSSPSSP